MTVGDTAVALDGVGHVTELIVAFFKTFGKTFVSSIYQVNVNVFLT